MLDARDMVEETDRDAPESENMPTVNERPRHDSKPVDAPRERD
jgi:hypothetical protein